LRTKLSSQILEKMTFKSTAAYPQKSLLNEIEEMGSQFQTIPSRESILYQSMVFEKDLERNIKILSQMVTSPKLDVNEMNDALKDAKYEYEDSRWDPLKTLPEKFHSVAYRDGQNKIDAIDYSCLNSLGIVLCRGIYFRHASSITVGIALGVNLR
jgi:predicted Zn-dependent peptidase